jgi:hypothetical protein
MPSGTLTASPGAYTVQRNAATLRRGRVVIATPAAYTVAGRRRRCDACGRSSAAAAYTIAPTGPTLRWGHKLVATVQTYTIAGRAAVLQKNARALQLPTTTAAYTIAATAPVLRWTHVLIATVQAYVVTGFAATLAKPRILAAITRTFAVVGSAAALTWSRVFAILPTLPGLTYPVQKKHVVNVAVHTTASGRELRSSWWRDPLFEWGLSYELLRTQLVNGVPFTEYDALAGFFNTVRGRAAAFLFDDVTDNVASNSLFDTGDGVTRTFTLRRVVGGGSAPIGAVNTITNVSVAGVTSTAYTIAGNQITFAVAPAVCADLTWTGTFFYKVRFRDDIASFANFMKYLWESKAIWLRQVK